MVVGGRVVMMWENNKTTSRMSFKRPGNLISMPCSLTTVDYRPLLLKRPNSKKSSSRSHVCVPTRSNPSTRVLRESIPSHINIMSRNRLFLFWNSTRSPGPKTLPLNSLCFNMYPTEIFGDTCRSHKIQMKLSKPCVMLLFSRKKAHEKYKLNHTDWNITVHPDNSLFLCQDVTALR